MSEAREKGRPIVVGTDGTANTMAQVREAAGLALLDGVDLHIVGAYTMADDSTHRGVRLHAPRDIEHQLSGRADAWSDVEVARLMLGERDDLVVHLHICQGGLVHAVRTVAEAVCGGIVLPERKRRRFVPRRPLLGQVETAG